MSVKHDWYQSDAKIVITVLLKNAAEKNYQVIIEKEKVKMTADNYELELTLYRNCIPERSSHKATASKVEISLAKETGERWENLEQKNVEPRLVVNKENQLNKQNWDQYLKDFEQQQQDEAKSEQALNHLFQKIYGESSDEVRKAMNKSYMESGGTVLSTNWGDVGKDKVEVKPPDGTEFKTWDG